MSRGDYGKQSAALLFQLLGSFIDRFIYRYALLKREVPDLA